MDSLKDFQTRGNDLNAIKAIETSYQGYRFRSRLEARWAVFFDSLGVKWEYEREGFDLGKHGCYLPDFWLPDLQLWYEVKGELTWIQHESNGFAYRISPELQLMGAFRDAQEWPCACATGQIGNEQIWFYAWDSTDSSGGSYDEDDARWIYVNGMATLDVNPGRLDREFVSDNLMGVAMPQFSISREWCRDTQDNKVVAAIVAARSARFEHGETPRVRA